MSPGAGEEAAKAAQGVIAALRDHPAFLVLIVFNLIFLGAVAFAVHDQRNYQHQLMTRLIEKCG